MRLNFMFVSFLFDRKATWTLDIYAMSDDDDDYYYYFNL